MAQNLGHGSRLRIKRHQKPLAALSLYGTLSKSLFRDKLCPRCDTSVTAGLTYIQHLCVGHPELELDTVDKLCDMIIASNPHYYQHQPETNEIFASLLVCLFTVL